MSSNEALEKYDDSNYRVIKKLQRENKLPKNLDIIIISVEPIYWQLKDLRNFCPKEQE